MLKKITDCTIDYVPEQRLIDGFHFSDCRLGVFNRSTENRLWLRRLQVSNCRASDYSVGPVVFEDCIFHNLRAKSALWLRGAAFINCKCTGYIEGFLAFAEVNPSRITNDKENADIAAGNQAIYKTIDCALDLSEADCTDFRIHGIPLELLRINPEWHAKVSYRRAVELLAGLPVDSDEQRMLASLLSCRRLEGIDFLVTTTPRSTASSSPKEIIDLLRVGGALL